MIAAPSPDARGAAIAAFLAAAGWSTAMRAPLAGDASRRRYERLTDRATGARAVLMDAPPEAGEDIRPFCAIARHLHGLGLSAPAILAADAASGLLLLEDLGDGLYSAVAPGNAERERRLYAAAVDLLAELHRHPVPPDLPPYDADTMAARAALAADWYLPGATGAARDPSASSRLIAATRDALRRHAPQTDRVGLLDFQDAMAGHRGYDLVSLLCDARRDVPPALRDAMMARYADATGQPGAPFAAACAVLNVQRNLRILGVFARLSMHFGKPGYVDLIPRVWGHLARDLVHPACAGMRAAAADLPDPGPAVLARLRAEAGRWPAREAGAETQA